MLVRTTRPLNGINFQKQNQIQMRTTFIKPIASIQQSNFYQTIKMKTSSNKFFVYALELVALFFLVFATVSTFAQSQATAGNDPGKLEFTKQTIVFNSGKVYLNWIAKPNAIDCIYVIERSTDGDEYEPVGLKEGIGSPIELLYSWVDNKPATGTVQYRIKQINNDGNLVAQADPQAVTTPESPLFIDRGSRMVMVK